MNRTLINLHKFKSSPEITDPKHFYYYGSLKEELCDDNLSKIKHLINSTCEDTGIMTLFNSTLFQNADYKRIKYSQKLGQNNAEQFSGDRYKIKFTLTMTVNRRFMNKMDSRLKEMKSKQVRIVDLFNGKFQAENYFSCLNEDFSRIRLLQGDGMV
jgi:hypothetical protein